MSLGQTDSESPRLRHSARIAAVVSAYHPEITGGMFDSARQELLLAGVHEDDLQRVEAPGSFELPLLAQAFAERDDVDAVLCFGLVLRGETDHDRYISHAVSEGLMRVSLEAGKPVLFGVLTCNTLDQAQTRAKRETDGGLDKGREVARAAVMALNALEHATGQSRAVEEAR